jgi:hypothetical protein
MIKEIAVDLYKQLKYDQGKRKLLFFVGNEVCDRQDAENAYKAAISCTMYNLGIASLKASPDWPTLPLI